MRIADFGLATKIFLNEIHYKRCGSPGYVAPEILRDEGYTKVSDIFSLGSVFFNLVTGRYLFAGQTADEIILKNYNCDLSLMDKYLTNCSISLVNLLK